MKKNHRFIPLNPTTLCSLMALAGSAWAVSPYDAPYGIQWNFQIGATGDDGGSSTRTKIDVTSDGTVFVCNSISSLSTWGAGSTGSINGGVGAISPLGSLRYGTTLRDLPGMNSPGQNYPAGVTAAGNKAYFAIEGAQSQYWTGEDGKDANSVMVWSLDSSALSSIADRRSLSKFTNATGNPLRTDPLVPITTGLTPAAAQNRPLGSALRASTLDMVMVMDMVAGDFATLGDYGGFGLRTKSTAVGRDPAYLPGIGVYNFTSNTLTGPAKQPILTFNTSTDVNEVFTIQCVADSTGSLNNKYFDVLGINGNYRFWYSVGGAGTAPANPPNPNAGKFQIDIATDATADAVAAATQAVIDAQGAFGATVLSNVVTVTLADPGNSTQTNSGATGFTFTETTPGVKAAGSNMGDYRAAAIDQSTGFYYGGGISHSRTESSSTAWDPDGSGLAPSIPFVTSTSQANPAGIGTAYDSSHNLLYAVTWDTTGYDVISTIATTNDGSNGAFWAGEKLDDCHIELRDATGAIVWSDTFDMSPSVGVERIARVRVDANGDLFVTGYFENGGAGGGSNAYDTFVRKYEKTGPSAYALKWSKSIGLPGVQDFIGDSALNATDQTIYTVSATWGQWTNTTGFIRTDTNNDLLVQKLVPGDFNTDGIVDFTDVQLAGTATKPGLPGIDTYDFNNDGNSTLADTTYMITNIIDRLVGDIAQDPRATDVDNADIGKAIGASGVGTLYLDGDIDWDADVDGTDITAVAGAFTGSLTPSGYGAALAAGATLRYRASDGQVWLHADEATGDIITSFQLENAAGTFVPASFTGPTGGSFGGSLKQATTNVLADTDLTLAGAAGTSGLISLGKVFPTGMDLAGLTSYLKTAVYTGQAGSGQQRFTLLVGDILTPYQTWIGGPFSASLTNTYANIDFEGDGISTGLEFVLGGDPTANDAASIAPTSQYNGSGLVFTYRRTDLANTDPDAKIAVFYSTDLSNWTAAQHGVNGVTIVATDNHYSSSPGIDRVVVTLPSSLAPGGKLFARLGVGGLPISLLNENFESGNGGFTVVGSPNDWAWGTPNSNNGAGLLLTTGNAASAKCWATNLGIGGNPSGLIDPAANSILRSPNINLTGITGAQLSFAAAYDAQTGDAIQVLVRDAGTDALLGTINPVTATLPATSNWTNLGPFSLSAGDNKNIYLEFRYDGTDANYIGLYIDDVKVVTP